MPGPPDFRLDLRPSRQFAGTMRQVGEAMRQVGEAVARMGEQLRATLQPMTRMLERAQADMTRRRQLRAEYEQAQARGAARKARRDRRAERRRLHLLLRQAARA